MSTKELAAFLERGPHALSEVVAWFAPSSPWGGLWLEVERGFWKAIGNVTDAVADGIIELYPQMVATQEWIRRRKRRPGITRKVRARVLAAGKCAYCASATSLTVDHIEPVSQGGSDDLENLQCLCKSCNYWFKNTRSDAECRKELGL